MVAEHVQPFDFVISRAVQMKLQKYLIDYCNGKTEEAETSNEMENDRTDKQI